MLTVGDHVPSFALMSTAGPFTQQDFLGQWTVLYFYPRDNTPGCTQESCDFRDSSALFDSFSYRIVGVSRDNLSSHGRFREKHQLPFLLIADPEEVLCQMFGVMKDKVMYGKPVRGIDRSTFLIDPNGCIVREWRSVKVPGHVASILETISLGGDSRE